MVVDEIMGRAVPRLLCTAACEAVAEPSMLRSTGTTAGGFLPLADPVSSEKDEGNAAFSGTGSGGPAGTSIGGEPCVGFGCKDGVVGGAAIGWDGCGGPGSDSMMGVGPRS